MNTKKLYLTLLIFAGTIMLGKAQTSSISDGNWSDGANWTAGAPGNEVAIVNNNMTLDTDWNPGKSANYTINSPVIDASGGSAYNVGQSQNGIVDIDANITIEGTWELKNSADLIIRNNDTLRVGSDFSMSQNTDLTIEPSGVLIVNGDMNMRNSSASLIDGKISVGGDFSSRNSATIAGAGNLEVDGEIDVRNSSSVFGNSSDCSPGPCEYGSGAGLPIDLLSFKAEIYQEQHLKIEWITASEVNNDRFIVEISEDGEHFISLDEIAGAGNSSEKIAYSILKENPFPSNQTIYLKLSQVDFNGIKETFNAIVVQPEYSSQLNVISNDEMNIYPNPGNGNHLNLKLKNIDAGTYQIQILNSAGQLIKNDQLNINRFHTEYRTDLLGENRLESGIYFIRFGNGEMQLSQKYIVQ